MINTYASRKASEIPPQDLRMILTDLIKEAEMVMGGSSEKEYMAMLINWSYKLINDKFFYLPINHINAAFYYGALGQRGGTSKLIPRNIAIWISEQRAMFQEQVMRMQKKDDETRRAAEMQSGKAGGSVAAAVRIKVGWLADGMITGDEYDSFSSKAIYDLLISGRLDKTIHPREVVPDYDLHRQE